MTQQEFEQRTGITSHVVFEEANKMYMAAGDMDKDAFCDDYKAHGDSILLAYFYRHSNYLETQKKEVDSLKREMAAFLLGKAEGPFLQRLGQQGTAGLFPFLADGAFPLAAADERNVQGVHAGNDHGAREAAASFDGEGRIPVGAFKLPVHVRLFGLGFKFRGGDEQAHALRGKTPADAACEHRQRNGEHEADGDGGEPHEEARVDEPHHAAPQKTDERAPPVEAYGVAPARARVAAVLRVPRDLPAEQRGDHEEAVEEHSYRSKQGGDEHFAEHAHAHAERAAEVFGSSLAQGKDDGEYLGHEQHDAGAAEQQQRPFGVPGGPHGEERGTVREVGRRNERFGNGLNGAEHEEEQPQKRRGVGHDAVDEQRAVRGEDAAGGALSAVP